MECYHISLSLVVAAAQIKLNRRNHLSFLILPAGLGKQGSPCMVSVESSVVYVVRPQDTMSASDTDCTLSDGTQTTLASSGSQMSLACESRDEDWNEGEEYRIAGIVVDVS